MQQPNKLAAFLVLDSKAINIKKYMKEANDFSTYCGNKPAETTFNQFVE